MTKEQTKRITDLFLQRMHCYNASLDEKDKQTRHNYGRTNTHTYGGYGCYEPFSHAVNQQ